MAGEIQLNSTTFATESDGTVTVSNVDSATNRTNLGLGSIATQAADSVSISGGNITGGTIGSGVTFPNFIPEIIAAARFDGSDGSSISLFNFNEPSRNSTGDYSLTFSTARGSVDFLIFHTGIDSNNNYLDHLVYSVSTTGFSLEYRRAGTAEDVTESNVIVIKFPIT